MWDLIVSVPDHCLSFYLDNLTKIQSSNVWISEMRKYCIFRCVENRCWGCRELKSSLSSIWSFVLAPYAVFPLGFTFNTLHDLLKVIVL